MASPRARGLWARTFKEEHVDHADYQDYDDAFVQMALCAHSVLAHWLEIEYMTERIHPSLGYLTPAEFEAAAIAGNHSPSGLADFVSK